MNNYNPPTDTGKLVEALDTAFRRAGGLPALIRSPGGKSVVIAMCVKEVEAFYAPILASTSKDRPWPNAAAAESVWARERLEGALESAYEAPRKSDVRIVLDLLTSKNEENNWLKELGCETFRIALHHQEAHYRAEFLLSVLAACAEQLRFEVSDLTAEADAEQHWCSRAVAAEALTLTLRAENERLNDRNVEVSILADGWMRRHDAIQELTPWALLKDAQLPPLPSPSDVPNLRAENERMKGALREMRDISFGVSGKSKLQINDWFNERARDALSSLGLVGEVQGEDQGAARDHAPTTSAAPVASDVAGQRRSGTEQ